MEHVRARLGKWMLAEWAREKGKSTLIAFMPTRTSKHYMNTQIWTVTGSLDADDEPVWIITGGWKNGAAVTREGAEAMVDGEAEVFCYGMEK